MKVRVSARGAARILARHPWVYKSDVLEGPQTPGLYPVQGPRGSLGLALYNPLSEISVRVFAFEEADSPLEALLANLRQALARRKAALMAEPEGAFRLVHAEGDLLPGLVLDYYAGHGVVQVGSAALEPLTQRFVEVLQDEVAMESLLAKNNHKPRSLEGLPLEVRPLWGRVPDAVTAWEGSVLYRANSRSEGQKTGAFIDQRENCNPAQRASGGKTALDAFSYHGLLRLSHSGPGLWNRPSPGYLPRPFAGPRKTPGSTGWAT